MSVKQIAGIVIEIKKYEKIEEGKEREQLLVSFHIGVNAARSFYINLKTY